MKCILTLFKVLYSLVVFSLFIFSINSYAVIAPPGIVVQSNGKFGSASAYCQSAATALGRTYKEVVSTVVTSNPGSTVGGTHTGLASLANGGSTFVCRDINNATYGQIGTDGQYCLSADSPVNNNGTLTCSVCPPGTTDVNGTCTVPPECPTAGTKKTNPLALTGISGQQGIGVSMCADSGGSSCGISCKSGIASYNETSGQSSVYCDSYEFSGSACSSTAPIATSVSSVPTQNQATPVNTPPKSKADCPGGSGFAEINNVGMCLPSGTQYTAGSSTTSSESGSVTSTSTTTINNNGTSTTTTINTYKDAAGNVTYSGTGTQTGSTNLADGTTPGGQKGTNPTDLGTAPTFDSTLPGEGAFTPKVQSNPIISTTIFNSSSSCPAPIEFSAMNQAFTISFQPICDLSDIIRGIVLLLSGIVAMRAVVSN